MTKDKIRSMNVVELREEIQERYDSGGLNMTNYERSQYFRKLKKQGTKMSNLRQSVINKKVK